MARKGSYTYDPKTQSWTSNSVEESAPQSTQQMASKSSGDNLISSSTNKDTAAGNAEKKYNTIEYNYLSGTLTFIATKQTIKLRAGDTVNLQGLGKYLTGLYYVQDVTRNISKDGYSHTATLLKTDFGNSLKSITNDTPPPAQAAEQPVPKEPEQRVYYLKKGDCLWKVAQMYYGSGAQYPKLATANNISPSQYTRLPIGMKIIIP